MEAIHLSEYLVAVVIVQTVCGRVVWELGGQFILNLTLVHRMTAGALIVAIKKDLHGRVCGVGVWGCGGVLWRCGGVLWRCGGVLWRCGGVLWRCGGVLWWCGGVL